MNNIIFLMSLLVFSISSTASSSWSIAEFQKSDFFDSSRVQKVEQVFYDEMSDETFYEVTYIKNENSSEVCQYFIVDNPDQYVEATDVSCDQPIEDVIGEPILWDEL